MTLTAHVADLDVGRYETHLVVTAGEGVIGSPQEIPVTLIVAEELYDVALPLVPRGAGGR